MKLPDEKRWIPYSAIEEEAMARRKANKEPMPTPPKDILDRRSIDRYIVDVIREKIDNFFPRDDAEELLIGPGVPDAERGEMRAYAQSIGLKIDQRQWDGNSYYIIYSRQDIRKIADTLKKMGPNSVYGRFKLIPRSQCPKHSDVLKSTSTPANIRK